MVFVCYGAGMNSLNLDNVPAGSWDGGDGWLPVVLFFVGMISCVLSLLWVVTIASSVGRKKGGIFLPALVVILCVVNAGLFASSFIAKANYDSAWKAHHREYVRESSKIVDRNVDAVEAWANSTYLVRVDNANARELLGAFDTSEDSASNGSYVEDLIEEDAIPMSYSDLEGSRVEPLGSTYVRGVSGKSEGVLKVQLTWDGEKYVLLQVGGGEVERR